MRSALQTEQDRRRDAFVEKEKYWIAKAAQTMEGKGRRFISRGDEGRDEEWK